ncbi:hypothetical protein K493DRAFT_364870 [Basidiobolus meristosporus CBS 931.73]|uniref:Uncharacterized protein n=1 Tax=Basidiobolus meristosporus CBS 931.73 TaxID=1314790 RepID=A0A1Y1VTH7_9FUNG|nr:hypothetical protein K493DRAFT_364870 [Basidiobolus meristosporus CBS 931.73]|eukprot:ORX64600.1 hypothetical protein K493DRAFT_364870 [Basidiobolus meristosporus CBS 931.73]
MKYSLFITFFALSASAVYIPKDTADNSSNGHVQPYGDQKSKPYDRKYDGDIADDAINIYEGNKNHYEEGDYKQGGSDSYAGRGYTHKYGPEYANSGIYHKDRRDRGGYGDEKGHRRGDYLHEDSYGDHIYNTESRKNEKYHNKSGKYDNDNSKIGNDHVVNYQDNGYRKGDNYRDDLSNSYGSVSGRIYKY